MAGKEIEVDEDAPKAEVAPKEEPKQEAQYVTLEQLESIRKQSEKIEKQLNGLSYYGRKVDEVIKRLDAQTSNQPQPVATPPIPATEWDVKLNTNWKGTVEELADIRAEQKYRSLRAAEKAEEARIAMLTQQRNILEDNKRKVVEKYPELNDPTSEVSQKFLSIVSRHQEYLNNEYGPVLAMREMEDELRNEGKLDPQAKQVVEKEIARQNRVAATTSITKSKPSETSGNKALSSEEIKMCKDNGINPDTYLKMRRQLSSENKAEV